MNEAAEACRKTIEQFVTLMPEHRLWRLLLRYGEAFDRPRRGRRYDVRKGVPKRCFQNAGQIAQIRPDLRYAEGYALRPGLIPMMHGWLVDAAGAVLDPTWRWEEGLGYFGIIFTPGEHEEALELGRHWGLLDYPWAGIKVLEKRGA